MGELFNQTIGRNVEEDCGNMTQMLQENGWILVDGVYRRVSFSNVPILNRFFDVEPGSITLFSAGDDVDRIIRTSLATGVMTYMAMPHLLLANRTVRFGLIQIAGGTAKGVYNYR